MPEKPTRLAKSNHVVLAEGAANMRRLGGPIHLADRMDQLAKLAKERPDEYRRHGLFILSKLPEEKQTP